MEEPILYVSCKKYTGESTIVSMRIPKDMLRDFDDVARRTGRTRNELLAMSLEFALRYLSVAPAEQQNKKQKKKGS